MPPTNLPKECAPIAEYIRENVPRPDEIPFLDIDEDPPTLRFFNQRGCCPMGCLEAESAAKRVALLNSDPASPKASQGKEGDK